MKRLSAVITVICVIAVLLGGCAGGEVGDVKKIIGDSQRFDAREIENAMDVAIRFFDREFTGCTLTHMIYDEEFSAKTGAAEAAFYGTEEAIVLTSRFETDAAGGEGNLEPNSTYKNYKWILTRSNGGTWKLRSWGYA